MTRREFLRLTVIAGRRSRPKLARVDRDLCIAWSDGPCRVCETRCPVERGALSWERGPVIDPSTCDGCGKCVEACSAVNQPCAIVLE